jgi:AcrR family transcriptional regulator
MLDEVGRDELVAHLEILLVEALLDQPADDRRGILSHDTLLSIKRYFIEYVATLSDVAEPVKRRYRSARRQQQTSQTRARILEAADAVFRERGYERATISAVAAEAGVADETVYMHFKNKRTLLGELVQGAVRGGDPRPVPEQDAPRALAAVPDQREQLRLFARDISERLERAAPLVVLVSEGATGEPELAGLLERLHSHRLRNLRTLVDALGANGQLRLPRQAATETVWALTSPELHQLLVRRRGWSRRRYASWLARSLEALLLAHPDPGTAAR